MFLPQKRGITPDGSSLCTVSDSYKDPCKVQLSSNNLLAEFLLDVIIQQSSMHRSWCIPWKSV